METFSFKLLCFILLTNLCAANVKNILTEDGPSWAEVTPILREKTTFIAKKFEPFILKHYPYGKVSEKCEKSLISYANGIKEWEGWPIKMLDATGKLPSTFLSGTMVRFGSWDDCMEIEAGSTNETDSFKGQYCFMSLKSHRFLPSNWKTSNGRNFLEAYKDAPEWFKIAMTNNHIQNISGAYMGICTPSLCSEDDLITVVSALMKPFDAEVSITDCQTRDSKEWPIFRKIAFYAFLCWFGLCIAGTIKDNRDRKRKNETSAADMTFLKAFSLRKNARTVFEKEATTSSLDCIHGIKVFVTASIILIHLINYPTVWKEQRFTNFHHMFKAIFLMLKVVEFDDIVIEALFLISGFSLVYTIWPKLEKTKGKLNAFQKGFEEYWSQTSVLVFTILFSFFITTLYFSPVWESTWKAELDKCQEFGWKNLLYYQNFETMKTTCWPHTWYLAVSMQFLITSLPLMIVTYKFPKAGISLALLFLSAFIFNDYQTSIDNTYTFMTPKSFKMTDNDSSIVSNIYIKPFHHFSANILGMFIGWVVLKHGDKKLPLTLRSIGWILCIGLKLGVIYFMNYPTDDIRVTALYNSVRNIIWSLSVAWEVYALTTGSGGFIGSILSWSIMVPLSKLSFGAYLMHPIYLVFREASLKERIHVGIYAHVIEFAAAWYYSYLFAFIAYIMAERPFRNICDLWFRKRTSVKSPEYEIFGQENHCGNSKMLKKEL